MKNQQRIYMQRIIDNTAPILVLLIVVINIILLVVIAAQHESRHEPMKTVTITGFQEPLMSGYSFLESKDKIKLSDKDKVDIRQDLGVKATITTYRDNETPIVETADVWMWKMVQ